MNLVIFTPQIGYYHDARFRALAELNVDFAVVAFYNDAEFPEFLTKRRGNYLVRWLFENRDDFDKACTNGSVWRVVQNTLNDLTPSIVAASGWASPVSYSAVSWARSTGSRIIMQSDSQKRDNARSPVKEWIKSRVVRMADAALVAGPTQKNYAVELGISADRVFTGFYAVDNEHFSSRSLDAQRNPEVARKKYGLPPTYFLAVARFIPKKNLKGLVDAYSQARLGLEDFPDLVILGDGPERSFLESRIGELNLQDRIHLPGFRGYYDLPAIYGLAEAFIHVSTSEQWGLVVNEAASSGLPLIVSDACGSAQTLVRNGINGFIVDARSTESIAIAMKRIMDASPLHRREMGRLSYSLVSEWGPDRFARELVAACRAAHNYPRRNFRSWDRALLHFLSTQHTDKPQ